MEVNEPGKAMIMEHEGCMLIAYPDVRSALSFACKAARISIYNNGYKDLTDWEKLDGTPWTIGWGYTSKLIMPGVIWRQIDADWALDVRIHQLMIQINLQLEHKSMKANANQLGAMIDFAYNCGFGNFCHVLDNIESIQGFPEKIQEYIHDKHGLVVKTLIRRRAEEKDLFNKVV